jgi:hypothetical protein
MQLAELKYRADMSADPIWEKRYRIALQYDLPNPVNLDDVNRIMGGNQFFHKPAEPVLPSVWKVEGSDRPGKADTETWRDRKPLL